MLSVVTAQEEQPHWRRTQGTEGTPPFRSCPFSPPQPGLRAACSLQSHTPEPSDTQHLSAVPHGILIYLPGNCSQRPPSERGHGACLAGHPFSVISAKSPPALTCGLHPAVTILMLALFLSGGGGVVQPGVNGEETEPWVPHTGVHTHTHICAHAHTCACTHTLLPWAKKRDKLVQGSSSGFITWKCGFSVCRRGRSSPRKPRGPLRGALSQLRRSGMFERAVILGAQRVVLMWANPPSSPHSPDKPNEHHPGLLPAKGPAPDGDLTSLEMHLLSSPYPLIILYPGFCYFLVFQVLPPPIQGRTGLSYTKADEG